MLQESKRLENLINSLKIQLSTLPEGKLICCHAGKYYKWYYKPGSNANFDHHIDNSDNQRKYIPKSARPLAEKLALRKYLSLLLEDAVKEKQAINFYLRHHSKDPLKASQLLADYPAYQELLSPYFKPFSEELSQWQNDTYEHNPKYPEHLIHKSISGNLLRSKSESLIDMLLYTNKIPFRYECALQLGESIFYPDFTIRHPVTGKTYYWEHFGKADDPYYRQTTISKLQAYISHGIIPSIQLITTYETLDSPLTLDIIEKIIHHYFLTPTSNIFLGT